MLQIFILKSHHSGTTVVTNLDIFVLAAEPSYDSPIPISCTAEISFGTELAHIEHYYDSESRISLKKKTRCKKRLKPSSPAPAHLTRRTLLVSRSNDLISASSCIHSFPLSFAMSDMASRSPGHKVLVNAVNHITYLYLSRFLVALSPLFAISYMASRKPRDARYFVDALNHITYVLVLLPIPNGAGYLQWCCLSSVNFLLYCLLARAIKRKARCIQKVP